MSAAGAQDLSRLNQEEVGSAAETTRERFRSLCEARPSTLPVKRARPYADGTMSAQIKTLPGGCMQRTLLAVCAASVIGLTPLLAQSTRPSEQYDSKDTTITGCLQKNKSGGFWLTDASIDSAGAKASTTTGTSGTSTTTSGDKDVRRATDRGLWNLENGKDLDRYLNQRIQVTGRAKKDTSGDELKGTTGKEMDARDFDVKSVTKISDSCR